MKVGEIAMMEFDSPTNKLTQKDGSLAKFLHDDPLLIMAKIKS